MSQSLPAWDERSQPPWHSVSTRAGWGRQASSGPLPDLQAPTSFRKWRTLTFQVPQWSTLVNELILEKSLPWPTASPPEIPMKNTDVPSDHWVRPHSEPLSSSIHPNANAHLSDTSGGENEKVPVEALHTLWNVIGEGFLCLLLRASTAGIR